VDPTCQALLPACIAALGRAAVDPRRSWPCPLPSFEPQGAPLTRLLPCLESPFKPPLNPTLPSMVLTPLTSIGYRPLPPPRCSPSPYKRQAPPLEHPAPFPLTLKLSLAFLCSRIELEPPPLFTIVPPPLRYLLCSSEHPSAPPCPACLPQPLSVSIGEVPLHPLSTPLLVHCGPGRVAGP
jgi:hypothetical protein